METSNLLTQTNYPFTSLETNSTGQNNSTGIKIIILLLIVLIVIAIGFRLLKITEEKEAKN